MEPWRPPLTSLLMPAMSPYQQRAVVSERVDAAETNSLSIQVQSFGFKKGAPVDADIVLDMRMLANPR